MDELNVSWGVIETPVERATVAMERVAAILKIIVIVTMMMNSGTLLDVTGDLV
jgi:hypothetical protein